MEKRAILSLLSLLALSASAHAEGDARKGAEYYRACVSCHSLVPGVHLTGPSLAGAWGRKAGTAEGYIRYSEKLKNSGIVWDENTLGAWLADPNGLVPGTYMVLPQGFREDQS